MHDGQQIKTIVLLSRDLLLRMIFSKGQVETDVCRRMEKNPTLDEPERNEETVEKNEKCWRRA